MPCGFQVLTQPIHFYYLNYAVCLNIKQFAPSANDRSQYVARRAQKSGRNSGQETEQKV
jgi:hypothetical protein